MHMEKHLNRALELFGEISAIPRCSGNEARLRAWIESWASRRGLATLGDSTGNLLVKVPASAGYESAPGVILQGHMDMVCEKTPESSHDFTKDPIAVIRDGDWIHAENTTLGADNGIAVALAMTVAESDHPHPRLDLLFTVEEETGLIGASNLDPGMLTADILLNLDWETQAEFAVGCAGGRISSLEMPLAPTAALDDGLFITVSASGMTGGHSGVDIHKNRANANRVLAEILKEFRPFRLVEIHGGTAPNAIPREARATILANPDPTSGGRAAAESRADALRRAYASTDPGLKVRFGEAAGMKNSPVIPSAVSSVIVDMLLALPNGVIAMDNEMEGLVETSCNLAKVDTQNSAKELRVILNQRSSRPSRMEEVTGRIEAVASLAGCRAETTGDYPPWTPRLDSPLLARSMNRYEKLFGTPPGIRIVHAGLECGIIGAIRPGMDMLSLGPTIENPHSPAERMSRDSVGRILLYLTEILRSLAEEPLAESETARGFGKSGQKRG
jgi:dipeptidase D